MYICNYSILLESSVVLKNNQHSDHEAATATYLTRFGQIIGILVMIYNPLGLYQRIYIDYSSDIINFMELLHY